MIKPKTVITPFDLALGRIIRTKRKEAGVTQTFVALAVGVSFQQIQKYETGIDRMSVGRFVSICIALKLNMGKVLLNALEEVQ